MIRSYTVEEVAEAHLPAQWSDRVRWLKRRLASGEIPGKRLNRNTWVMTDEDIETWLMTRDTPPRSATGPTIDSSGAGDRALVINGLSARSRRRLITGDM